MIVDERMVTYINSLDEGHTPFLEALERRQRRLTFPSSAGRCRAF